MEKEVKVLNHGFVRLDDYLADDLSVVNSARVSFAQKSNYDMIKIGDECYCEDPFMICDCFSYKKVLSEKDTGLIRFLMKNRHGTPFEHNLFRFHIKCPIFVAREWQRHRIGSYNEWSARYDKLQPEFYYPDQFRTQEGKPGAYKFVPIENKQITLRAKSALDRAYSASWKAYEDMLDMGIAKELARDVLPVGIFTQFYWSVNARSLMNFLSLRNAETAMTEIRAYAEVIEEIFKEKMSVTAQCFIENGRICP